MKIDRGASVAVVVYRTWVNLYWVRKFIRYHEEPEREVRGDESHVLLARVLDADDPHGLWIELYPARHEQDPVASTFKLMVPWNQILSVILPEKEFPGDVVDEARKIGVRG